MSVINTNVSAMQAQNSLRSTSLNLSNAMERLSTGTRINSAKDDAAGLAISTRMTASIRGISAAIRNANDGISLTQTAEGSLSQISDNLQRVRELAVQSSNTGNSASDRAAMNNEAKQLVAEIDRVASNTAFNGIKLLDGSFQNQALQVGAGNDANDRITISVSSAKSNSLGVGSNSSYAAKTTGVSVGATALAASALNINGFSVGAAQADGVSNTASSTSGIAVAAAINAISAKTNVTATVGHTTIVGQGATGFATGIEAGDVKINGVSIGPISVASTAVGRGGQVSAAVNAVSSQTGVTATFDKTTGAVALNSADGRNISVEAVNAGGANNVTGLGSGTGFSVDGTVLSSTVAIAAGTVSINGVALRAVTGDATAVTTQGVNASAAVTTEGASVSAAVTTQGKALLAAPVAANTTAGSNGVTNQIDRVTFLSMTAGQAVTVAGLTFTASEAMTANEVGKAFGSLTTGITGVNAQARTGYDEATIKGVYTGTFMAATTGINTGTADTAVITYDSQVTGTTPVSTAGSAASTETSAITFSALAANESVTLNGLTYTATAAMSATQVGAAFANALSGETAVNVASRNGASDDLGNYTGTFTAGFTTAGATAGVVTATSTTPDSNVTNIALSTTRTAVTESSVITFSALAAGKSVTLNGLTYTATAAMSATQVGAAFARVLSNEAAADVTSRNTASAALGTYSGTFTAGFTTGGTAGTDNVTATSTGVHTNVTNIALSSTIDAESSVITFSALAAGESATLNGLTYTSTGASTATQVGAAFASALSGETAVNVAIRNTASAARGTYTGTFTAGFTTAGATAGVVTATSTTQANVTNISTAGSKALNVAAAVNAVTLQTGVTAEAHSGAVDLTSNGRAIIFTGNDVTTTGISELTADNTTALIAVNTLTTRSTVELSTTDAAGINVSGSTAAALTAAGLTESSATVVTTAGAGVSSIDLTTAAGSQAALTTLDSAINTITDSRATMGAYQNRLTASISNLESTSMNLSASRSRILDTDYAKETTNLAKAQIISQAATAMLAQANQSGQSVLALLK